MKKFVALPTKEKGRTAMNNWENNDSEILWALYSIYIKNIAQEPATDIFTLFLTKGLTTQKHCWQYTDPKKFGQQGHCAGL